MIINYIIVSVFILYIIGFLFLINFYYNTFIRLKREKTPNWNEKIFGTFNLGKGGGWIGGSEYRFRPPLPISDDENDNGEILKARQKHDRLIAIFWISILAIIPLYIIILWIINY